MRGIAGRAMDGSSADGVTGRADVGGANGNLVNPSGEKSAALVSCGLANLHQIHVDLMRRVAGSA